MGVPKPFTAGVADMIFANKTEARLPAEPFFVRVGNSLLSSLRNFI